MAKRTRNRHLSLMLSDEEFEFFKQQKYRSGVSNYTDFLMKVVSQSQVISIDTRPLLVLAEQVSKIGVNVNQVAKIANITRSVFEDDVRLLQEKIDEMDSLINSAIGVLSNVRESDLYGLCKNKTSKK
jgi:hypothetical protein